jgi:hypothetical protein
MPSKPAAAAKDAVALGVARGLSVSAAARAAGVSERTARAWANAPDFKQTVRRAREHVIDQVVGCMNTLAVKATVNLGKLIDSADEDVSLKASVALLDRLLAVREAVELEDRLTALEARGTADGKPPALWQAR